MPGRSGCHTSEKRGHTRALIVPTSWAGRPPGHRVRQLSEGPGPSRPLTVDGTARAGRRSTALQVRDGLPAVLGLPRDGVEPPTFRSSVRESGGPSDPKAPRAWGHMWGHMAGVPTTDDRKAPQGLLQIRRATAHPQARPLRVRRLWIRVPRGPLSHHRRSDGLSVGKREDRWTPRGHVWCS